MNGFYLLTLPLLMLMLSTVGAQAQSDPATTSSSATNTSTYGISTEHSLSAGFLENRGQWDSRARFLAQTDGLDIWISDGAIVYDLHEIVETASAQDRLGHVVRMSFVHGGTGAAVGIRPQPGRYNFLLGNDPSNWTTNVRRFATVELERIYDGIDAVLYFDGNAPRYDLHVAAGADPSDIRIKYEGTDRIRTASGDTLLLGTSLGDIVQTGLVAYQQIGATARRVECSFRPNDDGTVGFTLGEYDRTRPLVIDPLLYSTYLGTPTGTQGRTEIRSIAVDRDGNTFVTGANTIGTVPYPTTPGAYRSQHYGGGFDLFVTKLSHGGDTLIYSTFLGGNGSDEGNAIALDTVGFAYVAGSTTSDNFPITSGSYQTTRAGTYTGFITKLNFDGTGLAYSTYINDAYCSALVIDNAKNAYVTGPALVGFATIPTSYQATYGKGNTDAYVLKLNSVGTAVVYSTFVGGAGNDIGVAITVDKSFSVYITGNTNSSTFPTTQGAYQTILNGNNEDYFVTKLNPDGKGVAYSTMLGGSDYDKSLAIAIDKEGEAYITGNTRSPDYPTTQGAYQGTYGGQDNLKRYGDAFVTKLSADGKQLVYSTLIGSTGGDRGNGIAVDVLGNAYVAGTTAGSGFPTTANAYQPNIRGNYDAFFAKLNTDGSQIGYSTFIGGTRADSATGIALDGSGGTYIAGYTSSLNYPVSSRAYQKTYGGTGNGFISAFSALRVTMPNGNDHWCGGTNQTITWDALGTGLVDIYLSTDGGATYNQIAEAISDNSYQWTIPLTQKGGDAYRIKIVERGTNYSDVGDGTFTIDPYPSIVTQPTDIIRNAGDSAVFTSSIGGATTVKWQVSTNGGITWNEIPGETGTTLVLRNVQTSQTRTVYRAIFTNQCATIASDSALLTVVSLKFAKPSAGEPLCAGGTTSVLWNLTGFTGTPSGYDLDYSSDGGESWTPIDASISTNSYAWEIPKDLAGGTNYKLRVRLRNTGVVAITDNDITIGALPMVSADPTDVTKDPGMQAEFVAVAEGGVASDGVRWQVSSDDGQTWRSVPTDAQSVEVLAEGTSSTVVVADPKQSDDGSRYRAIFTNGCGSDTTQPGTLHVTSGPTGVDDPSTIDRSLSIAVEPNPSHGEARLRLRLPRNMESRIEIVNGAGQIVRRIDAGSPEAGEHLIQLDLDDLPNGSYTCTLYAGSERRSVKMTLIR